MSACCTVVGPKHSTRLPGHDLVGQRVRVFKRRKYESWLDFHAGVVTGFLNGRHAVLFDNSGEYERCEEDLTQSQWEFESPPAVSASLADVSSDSDFEAELEAQLLASGGLSSPTLGRAASESPPLSPPPYSPSDTDSLAGHLVEPNPLLGALMHSSAVEEWEESAEDEEESAYIGATCGRGSEAKRGRNDCGTPGCNQEINHEGLCDTEKLSWRRPRVYYGDSSSDSSGATTPEANERLGAAGAAKDRDSRADELFYHAADVTPGAYKPPRQRQRSTDETPMSVEEARALLCVGLIFQPLSVPQLER